MTETQEAHAKGAARLTTPESADDAFSEVTEELTALRAIVEAASHSGGGEYFQALVRNLARVVDAHYAFVAEFASPEAHIKARTIAFWARERIAEVIELADHDVMDIARSRAAEQEVLDLLDEPPTR